MRTILVLLSLSITMECLAQQTSFFNYYSDSIDGLNRCNSILQLNDTLFVNYNIYWDANQSQYPVYTLIFTNEIGVPLFTKNANAWLTAPLRRTKLNKGFAGVGGYLCSGSNLALLVYNASGDTLWTRCYPQSQYNWGPMGTGFDVCRDSGFIVSGYQQIVKLDKYGDVQWVSPLPFITTDAHETIEGDFIVCGEGGAPYGVALFDSAGNLKWSQQHGTLYNPWLYFSATSVIQLADSNYLVSCMNDTSGSSTGVGWNLMKVDRNNGDTLQTFIFSPWTNMSSWHAYLMYLSDSSIFWGHTFYYQHFDKNMNLLGSYLIVPPGFWGGDIYDIQPTFDRGIVGSGLQLRNNINNMWQQGCYFKTDSNFQITNFTGMAEHTRDNPLYVFPNPASDYFNVGLPYMPAPIFLTITVYDVYGKLCFSKIAHSESDLRINCNDWPSGLYVVRGVDRKGVVSLGKVLINN